MLHSPEEDTSAMGRVEQPGDPVATTIGKSATNTAPEGTFADPSSRSESDRLQLPVVAEERRVRFQPAAGQRANGSSAPDQQQSTKGSSTPPPDKPIGSKSDSADIKKRLATLSRRIRKSVQDEYELMEKAKSVRDQRYQLTEEFESLARELKNRDEPASVDFLNAMPLPPKHPPLP